MPIVLMVYQVAIHAQISDKNEYKTVRISPPIFDTILETHRKDSICKQNNAEIVYLDHY